MPRKFIYYLLLFACLGNACEKEPLVFIYEIDERLERHMTRFYQEAEKRDIILPRNNLIVKFSDGLEEDKCGLCTRPKKNKEIQRVVEISERPECWDNLSYLNKETLLFHELGHCLLDRDHKDDLFPSGVPESIMATVLNGPYQECVYVFGGSEAVEKCNLSVRRDYYLDELFGTNAGFVPDWGR